MAGFGVGAFPSRGGGHPGAASVSCDGELV